MRMNSLCNTNNRFLADLQTKFIQPSRTLFLTLTNGFFFLFEFGLEFFALAN